MHRDQWAVTSIQAFKNKRTLDATELTTEHVLALKAHNLALKENKPSLGLSNLDMGRLLKAVELTSEDSTHTYAADITVWNKCNNLGPLDFWGPDNIFVKSKQPAKAQSPAPKIKMDRRQLEQAKDKATIKRLTQELLNQKALSEQKKALSEQKLEKARATCKRYREEKQELTSVVAALKKESPTCRLGRAAKRQQQRASQEVKRK